MKIKKKTVKTGQLALVMVGTVIGAGFASGAEIKMYFVQYGEMGLWSIGMVGGLLFLGIFGILKIAHEHGKKEYGAFTEILAGKWLGSVLDSVVTFSMLLGYGVMLAGSDAVFLQQWGVSSPVGSLIMAGGCAVALCRGTKGVMLVNGIITPILIAGIFLVGIYGIWIAPSVSETLELSVQPLSILTAQPLDNLSEALGSAVVYVSYNMLGAGAVLVGISDYIQSKHEMMLVGGWAAIILMLLTLVLGLATFLNYDTIVDIPIPALELLRGCEFGRQVYVFVLLGAMYTTAVADGFGFLNRIQAIWPIRTGLLWVGMTMAAWLLARIGFANLVAKGYRILGYVGCVQMILIVVHCILEKENIDGK